jgi:trk system potassium uptake protein TrkH
VNSREVLHVVGAVLLWIAAAMLPSLAFAIGEGLLVPWLAAAVWTAAAGGALWLLTPRHIDLNLREGIAVVGASWIAVTLAGSLPFLFTRALPNVVEAVFESVSGFTTTGATVFAEVEGLPRSILLWRSVSQWLGGMGIIVLGVAILPLVGTGGAQLFQAEVSGIATERLQPRIATTARLLWVTYAGLTGAFTVLYVAAGMSAFDAVNHAMTSLATGGFSTRTASIGAFAPAAQWIAVAAMFAGAVNFTLHYRMASGRWGAWTGDTEWRWFAGIVAASSLAVGATLVPRAGFSEAAMREVAVNVISISSTTGYASVDFAAWPAFGQVVLIGLMFVGGMAASTAGGFKVVRVAVIVKHAVAEVRRVLHPRGVFVTKLGRRPIRDDLVAGVLAYLALYMATHAAGTLALTALGLDLTSALSAALSSISSVGPGLGSVGPAAHYGDIGSAAQLVLVVCMLLGRLEFYTILVLLLPETWRRAGGDRVFE